MPTGIISKKPPFDFIGEIKGSKTSDLGFVLSRNSLTEEQLRECIEKFPKINWFSISCYQELSEEFIWEYKYRLKDYIWIIFKYQNISDDFTGLAYDGDISLITPSVDDIISAVVILHKED